MTDKGRSSTCPETHPTDGRTCERSESGHDGNHVVRSRYSITGWLLWRTPSDAASSQTFDKGRSQTDEAADRAVIDCFRDMLIAAGCKPDLLETVEAETRAKATDDARWFE